MKQALQQGWNSVLVSLFPRGSFCPGQDAILGDLGTVFVEF